jgi:hypothetical protein
MSLCARYLGITRLLARGRGGDDPVADKKHEVPQVPAPGGGTKDRSRNEDGRWRDKRSDAGKTHRKSK